MFGLRPLTSNIIGKRSIEYNSKSFCIKNSVCHKLPNFYIDLFSYVDLYSYMDLYFYVDLHSMVH